MPPAPAPTITSASAVIPDVTGTAGGATDGLSANKTFNIV